MDEIAVRKRLREIEPDLADPLTNPSDWAVLIEKHEMAVWKEGNHWWAVTKELEDIPLKEQCNPSLPWAICLAIIEANGGMGDE